MPTMDGHQKWEGSRGREGAVLIAGLLLQVEKPKVRADVVKDALERTSKTAPA